MKTNYKVGDRVKIIRTDPIENHRHCVEGNHEYGDIGTIVDFFVGGGGAKVEVKDKHGSGDNPWGRYWWEELEPVEEPEIEPQPGEPIIRKIHRV